MPSRSPSRLRRPRAVLASFAALGVSAVTLAGCTLIPGLLDGGTVDTVGQVPFETALAIPPLAESHVESDGTRVFELTAAVGSTEFHDGIATPTLGYNGTYLGPTLVAARDERVRGRSRERARRDHHAALARHAPSGRRWTAGRTSRSRPGRPGRRSGRSTSRRRRCGTTRTRTARPRSRCARGSPGCSSSTIPSSGALPLPRDYGVDDIPVVVQDAQFDSDRRVQTRRSDFVGALGDRAARQRHARPVPRRHDRRRAAAPAERLDRADLRLRIRRRPVVRPRSRPTVACSTRRSPPTALRLSPGERAEILVCA